jgi:uncharacterized protein
VIVDLAELRLKRKPLYVDSDFPESKLSVSGEIARLVEPVHTNLRIALESGRVTVQGRLGTVLGLKCCRCASEFEQSADKNFVLTYLPDPETVRDGEEFELEYDDLDVGFYRGDQLDLSVVLTEQILLEIPMKPVCRPNCKGLCDQCGIDLNVRACDCTREVMDPRLAALAEIKKRITN